jgi:membrane fusion protein, multidrug efflux system
MKTNGIACLLIVLSLLSCKNRDAAKAREEAVRVKLVRIADGPVVVPVHSAGIVTSGEESKLSFKTGGIVAKINFKEGDRVKRGKILASLNLSEINAGFEQAKNAYEKSLRDYERAKNLFADSVATLEQKQNAETALKVAVSNLEIARFNLEHSTITAPCDGVILRQFVRTDELVAQGYPVFLFGYTGRHWKVKAGLSDRDIVKINEGDSASVTVDAHPGIRFSAEVERVGEISNPYTGTYEVELTLQETNYRLASGFVAGVDLYPSSGKRYFLIPVGSIVENDVHTGYIFTINEGMTAKKLKVDIEAITGSMAAIRGIPGGVTEIVSEGAAYLKDGNKVLIVK